jgi:hypothetical protein
MENSIEGSQEMKDEGRHNCVLQWIFLYYFVMHLRHLAIYLISAVAFPHDHSRQVAQLQKL